MIKIRQAQYEDIPRIMRFIDNYWKKGHIMGNDRTMFEFQHVNNGEVYYILAEDDDEHTLYGAVGFIPMSYDKNPSVSMMMMMSLKNPERRMLAGEMSEKCRELYHFSNEISPGVSKKYAMALSVLEPERIGKLGHYYMLARRNDYTIAVINQVPEYKGNRVETDDIELISVSEKMFLDNDEIENLLSVGKPYRSKEYLLHRYYHHPYYKYLAFGLIDEKGIQGVFFGREIAILNSKILKLVDYIGYDEAIERTYNSLNKLLSNNNYEYIDFYCYGIPKEILYNAGFNILDDDSNIIPLYFEPFEQRNVDIYFNAEHKEGIHVFTGFGDQDRPSFVR